MRILIIGILLLFCGCKTSVPTINQPMAPVIIFDNQTINLGNVKRGETRDFSYSFTNSGKADLIIELVTSCKCAAIEWPQKPIEPGEKGVIKVTYDSTGQQLGLLTKTIDIIANTDPIVVEGFFTVFIEL